MKLEPNHHASCREWDRDFCSKVQQDDWLVICDLNEGMWNVARAIERDDFCFWVDDRQNGEEALRFDGEHHQYYAVMNDILSVHADKTTAMREIETLIPIFQTFHDSIRPALTKMRASVMLLRSNDRVLQ